MSRIVWSPAAIRDISRLRRFLADKNAEAAKRAIGTIRTSTRILAQHPEIGRLIDELQAEYRDWPIPFGASGYILRYRFDGRRVVVLGVRRGREAAFR